MIKKFAYRIIPAEDVAINSGVGIEELEGEPEVKDFFHYPERKQYISFDEWVEMGKPTDDSIHFVESHGESQPGKYRWMPGQATVNPDKNYSARINRKGLTIRANSDSKDELVDDLTELLDRLTPLAGEVGKPDEDKD